MTFIMTCFFDSCYSTALHLAVMARNEILFDLLLSCENIDLNARTQDGHTPLYYAVITSHNLSNANSLAARLVEKGAQSNPVIWFFAFTFICKNS